MCLCTHKEAYVYRWLWISGRHSNENNVTTVSEVVVYRKIEVYSTDTVTHLKFVIQLMAIQKQVFLPVNTLCLIQPLRQNVTESLEHHYRKIFLQILIFSESETPRTKVL